MDQNLLPNVQWQLWSALSYITKMKEDGTGPQTPVSVDSYQHGNNTPQFYTSNTQDLRVGDLFVISGGDPFQWVYAGGAGGTAAVSTRVTGIVTNSLFSTVGQLDGLTPGSPVIQTVTATPICPGDFDPLTGIGSGNGNAADGWKKDGTLTVWADDWASNACPGAIRTMGLRKGANAVEYLYWTVTPTQIAKYQNCELTFGVMVRQKVQSGSGTWKAFIFDDVNSVTPSAAGTGISYSDPVYGHFEFLTVTAPVAGNATTLEVGIETNGALADVYYVALPTLVFGSSLLQVNCRQNVNDEIRPVVHWNPPLLDGLHINAPSTDTPPGSGNYGWTVDLEAISLGRCHNTVAMVRAKIEFNTATVGAQIYAGSSLDDYLIFGPQATTPVSGETTVGGPSYIPLADDGTIAIFCTPSGLVLHGGSNGATFDFDLVQLAMAGGSH